MVLLTVALAGGAAALPARAARPPFDPCALLRPADLTHFAGWTLDSRERRRYNFNGATGTMCTYQTSQGVAVIIAPDHGTPYPGISPDNDVQSQSFTTKIDAIDASYLNGTIYFSVGHQSLAVRVVPNTHIASYQEVEPFAERAIARLLAAR